MTYIPGQKDPLFEAVQGIITGGTEEGRYARRALGFKPPLQESVRVEVVPESSRSYLLDRLVNRSGQDGPPGWKYGQRVYYGDQAFRVLEFNEDNGFYETLKLTLVSDDCSQRLRGVEASLVTYPTHTAPIREEADFLDEGDVLTESPPLVASMNAKMVAKWDQDGRDNKEAWTEIYHQLDFVLGGLEQQAQTLRRLLKLMYGGPLDAPDYGTQKMNGAANLAPAVMRAWTTLIDLDGRIQKVGAMKDTLSWAQQKKAMRQGR